MKSISLVLSLLLISLFQAGRALAQEKVMSKGDVSLPPTFSIFPQPDSPLQIISAETSWAVPGNTNIFQTFIVVKNVSQLTVRAYSTSRDGATSSNRQPLCFFMNLLPGQVMRTGKTDGRSSWQAPFRPDRPPTIWVDFVELSDGSVWGADNCHSRERLDGERSGARAQREQLLKILSADGPELLMEFIRNNALREMPRGERPKLPLPPPEGHSIVWQEGFSRGAETILRRVVEAERDWGPTAIEGALKLPYDASEAK